MIDRPRLISLTAAHGRVARVAIVEAKGSTPRDPGTDMLIWDNGQEGTIGGGRLEYDATLRARAALSGSPKSSLTRVALGPALGQCCGGATVLVTEVFDTETAHALPESGNHLRRVEGEASCPPSLSARTASGPRLVKGWLAEPMQRPGQVICIHGAGHVGLALAHILAPLPRIQLQVSDTRTDRLAALPIHTLPSPDPLALMAAAPDAAHHYIMTPDHETDFALCHAVLSRRFAQAGLIGSATKWARFRKRLAALGHSADRIAQIRCPIGQTALGREPQAIAIGVAADILRDLGATQTAEVAA